jgi:hypothetical protein
MELPNVIVRLMLRPALTLTLSAPLIVGRLVAFKGSV